MISTKCSEKIERKVYLGSDSRFCQNFKINYHNLTQKIIT